MDTTVLWMFSPQWVQVLQTYHPQINGIMYYSKCIRLIWQAVLKIWKLCNKHLHSCSHEQEDRSMLEAAVHWIFHEACQDPILQTMIEHTEPKRILSQPTCQICQWVTNSNNHIRAHSKAAQLQAKLCTQDIRQFFPPKSQDHAPTTVEKFTVPTLSDGIFNNMWVLVAV